MRAVQPIGRIPICCSDACRKAAYGGPAVTQARYLHGQGRRNEHDHRDQAPIETCVNNVLASPWEVRKLLIELARKINRDEFTTTDWIALEYGLDRLSEALAGRTQRTGRSPGHR